MNKPAGSAIFVVLAAGLLTHEGSKVAGQETSQKIVRAESTLVPKDTGKTSFGPWTPLCQHVLSEASGDGGSTSIEVSLAAPGKKLGIRLTQDAVAADAGDRWTACMPKKGSVRFMIATVPDPEETHLALDFDRYVESIAWAVGDSDYTLESYWFPWQPISDKEVPDIEKRKSAAEERAKRLEQPGSILFRKKGGDDLLLVLLIGEHPTSGVNRIAFRKAIEVIVSQSPKKQIYIAGPSFSGSLPSLRRLLDELRVKNVFTAPILIVSGQVTNPGVIKDFRRFSQWRFCTTVHDDTYAVSYFTKYLEEETQGLFHRTGTEGQQIAILSEDETSYGELGPFPTDNIDYESNVLRIRFPRGIARLRNATDEIPNVTNTTSAPGRTLVPDIPLILKAPGDDSIQSFAQQQTPASSEAVMLNIAGLLRRNQIRYAGLVATDPLDVLFLTRFLRAACPDLRIVIFSSDLLFVRVAHSWSLEGLLAVTTYPLLLKDEGLKNPPRRIAFPSSYAQGLYNACRRILLDPDEAGTDTCDADESQTKEDHSQTNRDEMLEYSNPFFQDTRTPPLWLTVLGHDSFWPVALIDSNADDCIEEAGVRLLQGPRLKAGRSSRGFNAEKPSLIWKVLFVLITVYCWFTLTGIAIMNLEEFKTGSKSFRAWLRSHPESKRSSARHRNLLEHKRPSALFNNLGAFFQSLRTFDYFRCLSLAPKGFHVAARAANLTIILITIATVNAMLFMAVRYEGEVPWQVLCALTVFGALLEAVWMTIVLTQEAVTCRRSDRKRRSQEPNYRPVFSSEPPILIAMAWLFFLTWVFGFFAVRFQPDVFHSNGFFDYRSLHPESGVSPMLPLVILAAGYYYWAWIQLRRLRLVEENKPEIPVKPCLCLSTREPRHSQPRESERPLIRQPKALEEEIQSTFGNRTIIFSLLLIVLWVALFRPDDQFRNFERKGYSWSLGLTLTVMYAMIITNWVRFLVLWRDFAQMLRFLEGHPLRGAFSRLPKDFTWVGIWTGAQRPTIITSARSLECVELLATNGVDLLTSTQLEELRETLNFIEPEERPQSDLYGPEFFEAYHKSQTLHSCAAREAWMLLGREWSDGASDSLAKAEESNKSEINEHQKIRWLLEEVVALRYVALIRYVLRQMRNFLEFVTTGFILLAVAASTYPFEGHRAIGSAHLILFLILGAGVVMVFLQMDRDPLLSRLSETKANAIGLDFVWRLLAYGTLPLLTLLVSQFPSIGNFVYSWVQPALQAVK